MVRFVGMVLALVAAFTFTSTVSAQDDPDCEDYPSQAAAQAVFNQDPYNDPYGLDGPPGPGYDGVQYLACEANPAPFAPPFNPNQGGVSPVPSRAPSASAQPGLPPTGAADSMTGLALGLGALMVAAGVGAHVALRRRAV